MAGEDPTVMNGDGLRERKQKEKHDDTNGHADSPTDPKRSDKTYGRTPDGTGKSLYPCIHQKWFIPFWF